ncbi:MAG: hypothetical protein OYL92_06620 [Acidobacteriota bacterium]|nr:hypothetical protein [Acidobacteriota bacterium]MDE3264627.1 hypothetical protein [Acidobacteriota bacterium]
MDVHRSIRIVAGPRVREVFLASVLLSSILTVAAEAQAARSIPITETVHTERPFELQLIDALRDFVPHVVRAQGTPGLNLGLTWESSLSVADSVR